MTMWKHWKKKHVSASTIDLPRRPRHWYWDCTPRASQVLGLSSHCAQVDAETHQRKTTYYDISNIVDWNPSARIAAKLLPTPCRRKWRSVEACMVDAETQKRHIMTYHVKFMWNPCEQIHVKSMWNPFEIHVKSMWTNPCKVHVKSMSSWLKPFSANHSKVAAHTL